MLTSRGFGTKWISWILSILQNSSFSVKINDTIGPYFVGGKGLKQGDSISPILFNLVADVFSRISAKAVRKKIISGIIPHIIPISLISLQYADDTVLFLDPDIDHAKNLKWL
uniref:Reverse transcriptase domain-containing protein n=1 Tax=Aegilops tauschii subsp. strangulata TaxID=200361 RepID=A0A453CZW1_AEGTS